MNKYRVVKTGVVFLAGIIASINVGALVTTLPDMEVRTSSNTAEMSTIFIWIGPSTIVGVMLIGPLYGRVNGLLLLSFCFVMMAVFGALAPTWTNLLVFQALIAAATAFFSCIITGCLSINRSLWKTSPAWMGPIFQMTSLTFGLGMALGPQVVKPFLGQYDTDINSLAGAGINVTTTTSANNERIQPVQKAYLIMAIMNVGMAIILTLTSTWFGVSTDQCNSIRDVVFQQDDVDDDFELIPDESDIKETSSKSVSDLLEEPQPTKLDACSRPGRILVSLIFVAFLMNAGRSIMFVGLLYTYLYEYLGWSVQASTSLLSMFHFVRFLVGIIVVFLARCASPTKLVAFDMASLSLSSILMLVAVSKEHSSDSLTKVGVMVATLGDSNVVPTLITLAAESIVVIAPVMSLFMAAYGVSVMVVGPIAGILLNYSVQSYPGLLLALVLACILALAVYYSILRWLKTSGHWPK